MSAPGHPGLFASRAGSMAEANRLVLVAARAPAVLGASRSANAFDGQVQFRCPATGSAHRFPPHQIGDVVLADEPGRLRRRVCPRRCNSSTAAAAGPR